MKIITPNTNIGPDSVQTSFLKDGAVTNAKIADGAITSAKIAVDVIVAEDIANNAITVAELQDNAVTTAKILDANVTTAKIADGSITAAKIADGTVVAAELASNSVTTAKIADDAVTLAKINTTGASNAQVLAYNSTSGAVEWTNDTDIDVGSITDKMKITETPSLLSPILHLETDNSGWDKTHILLEDSNDDVVAIVGRHNTGWPRYQTILTMDPNNTKPRTNVSENNPVVSAGSFVVDDKYTIKTVGTTDFTAIGSADNNVGTVFTATGVGSGSGDAYKGDGITFAGDYLFDFSKNYGDQEWISMDLNVWGAHNGFNIISRGYANGGVDGYNYKPIALKGSDVSVAIGSTPFGSTTEKLAFNDYGTAFSNGAVVHGLDRGTSNHQIQYTGTCTTNTPGVPSFEWIMHRRDSQNRVMEIMEATDYGSGDSAVVEIGKKLTINPVKVASAVPIELANLSSAPGSPTAGMMYFNTTDNKFYGYNGSSWVALDTQ